jgi:sugar/nucleoside kinase (ribokinase family)
LRARPSRPLVASDLPARWAEPSLVILAPLLPDDIDLPSFDGFAPEAPRALLAQGLQRVIAQSSTVVTRSRPSSDLIQAMTVTTTLFLSSEETSSWTYEDVTLLIGHGMRFVITRGAAGASIYGGGHGAIELDAVPTEAVDNTGAGDVFATSFMLAGAEGLDDTAAGILAGELAAAAVERTGPAALPARRIGEPATMPDSQPTHSQRSSS